MCALIGGFANPNAWIEKVKMSLESNGAELSSSYYPHPPEMLIHLAMN